MTSGESAVTWWSRRPYLLEYCSAQELWLPQGLGKCMFNNHDKQDELTKRHHTLFRLARGEFPHADGTFTVNVCYNFSATRHLMKSKSAQRLGQWNKYWLGNQHDRPAKRAIKQVWLWEIQVKSSTTRLFEPACSTSCHPSKQNEHCRIKLCLQNYQVLRDEQRLGAKCQSWPNG